MCSRGHVSETKEQFVRPKLKKPTTTRSRCLEQFLWQELYDEYVRYNERLHSIRPDKENTEYFDEFCKDVPKEDEGAKEALINVYPLYCTSAITIWNHDGDITKDFKRRSSVTLPTQLQKTQFG